MCTTVRHDVCSGAATGVVVAGVVVALAAFVGVVASGVLVVPAARVEPVAFVVDAG
jgi:hypothetical protein